MFNKKLIATLIVLLSTFPLLRAQNVYISPETGHLIAATTYDDETGFENGFSALWRHDQLGLSMVTADEGTLTNGYEIKNPAGNLNIVNGKLTVTGGMSADCYIVVSLPKGYRFTGYSITLDNDMNNHAYSRSFSTGGLNKVLYETNSDFNITNAKAQTTTMPARDDTQGYTINRQASNKTDMGNRLYFRLHKPDNTNDRYYGVSIRSFVVNFAADAPFEQPMQALPFSTAVGVAKASFMVGKPELGTIKPNTKNGKTYYSYDYRNVDDLEADNLLYQANAVASGKADDSNTATKTITRTINRDGLTTPQPWFALAKGNTDDDNTYYIETPVTLTSAAGHEFPTGYRITGAKLEFGLGQRETGGNTIGVNRHGEITYLEGDGTLDGSNPVTGWQLSNNRRLTLGRTTFYVRSSNQRYYLSTSGTFSTTATFYVDDQNRVYANINYRRYYIHESDVAGQPAVLNTDPNYAAQLISYPAFTPSANGFTAEVYDKTGKTVAETATISSSNANQTITITGLNNDAVKFKVSGLSDGSQALVRITLTMEHLNPYIHSLDVVGKDADDTKQDPLTQNFTADNFNVRGGHFEFNVPQGTAGHTWNFEFDNLTSNYTDETYKSDSYTGSTTGNARVAFVESKYFKSAEDLYADSYNPDYTPASDKLQVVEVGTVPFRFNNADQLANDNGQQAESQLEEYPFTVAGYKENSGYTDENGNVIHGDFQQLSLKAGQENIAYIIVADETRYNIAPTTATQHRYYAHYAMDIELQEKEYELTLDPVKVYDKTFYNDKDNNAKETSMWGIKVSTTESNGYAHLADIIDKISELCDNKTENGLESTDQILYVDMSALQSIVLPSSTRSDYLNQFREMMAPNCLVFLPKGTADKVDNFANKPEANGSFSANANIVIEDKLPFFSPYDINVPATSYAKYTRTITHSSTGKSNVTTLVLPFQFSVSNTDGTHTNDKANDRAGDGKTFTVSKLATTDVISADKGESIGDFDNNLVSYDYYVHFDIYKPSNGKTEAYKPYMVCISDDNQGEGNENFSVLEYGANVIATPKETTGLGKVKITDDDSKANGALDNASFTLTPSATMAGCTLAKNDEKCLYFSADRFRSSWTLTDAYNYVYVLPFRSWFAVGGSAFSKTQAYGVAFGNGETTGIEDIEAAKASDNGTYKIIRDGQLLIHTTNGTYTVDGRKVNQ